MERECLVLLRNVLFQQIFHGIFYNRPNPFFNSVFEFTNTMAGVNILEIIFFVFTFLKIFTGKKLLQKPASRILPLVLMSLLDKGLDLAGCHL